MSNLSEYDARQKYGWEKAAAFKDLTNLYNEHKMQVFDILYQKGMKGSGIAASSSLHEFVSYVLSNPDVYNKLKSEESVGFKMISAIWNFIKRTFGFKYEAMGKSALELADPNSVYGSILSRTIALSDASHIEENGAKLNHASPDNPLAHSLDKRREAIEDPVGHSFIKLRDMAKEMVKGGLPVDISQVKTRRELIDKIYGTNTAMPDWAVNEHRIATAADKIGAMVEGGKGSKIKNEILNLYSNASTSFSRLSEKTGKEFDKDLVHAGQNASEVHMMVKPIVEDVRKLWRDINGKNSKVDITVNNQTHSFPEHERLNLAIQMRNKGDRDFMMNNGLDTGEGNHIVFGATKEEKAKNFADFEKKIQYAVGSKGWMIASKMLEAAKMIGDKIEPIAKQYFGKDFQRIENYWRRFVSHPPEMKNNFGEQTNGAFNRFGNWNPLRERVTSNRALVVKNAFSVLEKMITESSNFVGHAPMVSKWRRILNNKTMRDAINTKMGSQYYDRMRKHLANIEGNYDSNGIPLVNTMFRFQDVARFSNPFVAIKQFANTPNIAVMFSTRDWVKSLRSLPAQDINKYLNGSGGAYLKYRLENRMQTPELFEHREQAGYRAITGDQGAMDKMRNASTAVISWADNYTVKQTITAAASYVERTQPELKGDAKIAAVNYAASEALFKLQPVGERGWKVELASKGLFGKIFTRYQHVPLAMFNQLQRSAMQLDRHPDDAHAQVDFIKTIVFGAVASGAILAGADYSKEQYYSWLKQNYGNVNDKEEERNLQRTAARFKWTWMASSADVLPAGRLFSQPIASFFTALQTGDSSELMRAERRAGQDIAFGSQLQNLVKVMSQTVHLKNQLQNSKIHTSKQWQHNQEARRKTISSLTSSALDLFSETMGIPVGSVNKLTGATNLIP